MLLLLSSSSVLAVLVLEVSLIVVGVSVLGSLGETQQTKKTNKQTNKQQQKQTTMTTTMTGKGAAAAGGSAAVGGVC
jgi:hypothetical protein